MSECTLIRTGVGNKASLYSITKCMLDRSCESYYELFAGALGIFFSMYNGMYKEEHINDISIDLASLYYALVNDSTTDRTMEGILAIEKLDDREEAQGQFNAAVKRLRGTGPIELSLLNDDEIVGMAVNTYLAYSQSFNGSTKGYSASKSNEEYRAEVRQNVNNAMERLRSKPTVTCMDSLNILKDKSITDNSRNQLILDPPYCGLYRYSERDYLSEMAEIESHIRLAECIKDAKAAVILCGYRSPNAEIPTIYDAVLGDEYRCYMVADTETKCEIITRGSRKKKAKEFIWTNREPSSMAWHYISNKDYRENITLDEYWYRINSLCEDGVIQGKAFMKYLRAYRALQV